LENPRQSYNQADHFLAPALAGTPDHDGVDDAAWARRACWTYSAKVFS
jgi:hypothetical protein